MGSDHFFKPRKTKGARMLVLTRKINEKIIIKTEGKEIVITPIQIKGNQTRIGVQADRDVTILRSEVMDRENKDGNTEKGNG